MRVTFALSRLPRQLPAIWLPPRMPGDDLKSGNLSSSGNVDNIDKGLADDAVRRLLVFCRFAANEIDTHERQFTETINRPGQSRCRPVSFRLN